MSKHAINVVSRRGMRLLRQAHDYQKMIDHALLMKLDKYNLATSNTIDSLQNKVAELNCMGNLYRNISRVKCGLQPIITPVHRLSEHELKQLNYE